MDKTEKLYYKFIKNFTYAFKNKLIRIKNLQNKRDTSLDSKY